MNDEERMKSGVSKEYRNDRIVVRWEPRLCIHTGNCLRGLPQVFNLSARPWISINAADADKIAEVVMTCPTGALTYERPDSAPSESKTEVVKITERPNGPLFVEGPVKIVAANGAVIKEGNRFSLCRCGHTQNRPFCDGTHKKINFRTTD